MREQNYNYFKQRYVRKNFENIKCFYICYLIKIFIYWIIYKLLEKYKVRK